MLRLALLLVASTLAVGWLNVSAASGLTGLSCVDELLMPSYGAIARKAGQPGTVISRVTVGRDGKLALIRSTAPDKFLIQEVETFLRYNATYKSSCRGQTITLKFTFVLDNVVPTANPRLNVKFRGPNEFVIETQPQAAIPDAVPLQSPKE